MNESTTVTTMVCRRCGQAAPGISGSSCLHCGSPLAAAPAFGAAPQTSAPAAPQTSAPAAPPTWDPAALPVSGPAAVPGQRGEPAASGWSGTPTEPMPTAWPAPAAGSPPTAAAPAPAFRFEPARIRSGPGLSRKSWLKIGVCGAVVLLAVVAFLVLRPEPPSPGGTVRDFFADLASGDTAAALALVVTGDGLSPESTPLLVPAALADAANRPTGATVTSSRLDTSGEFTMVTVTYKIREESIQQVIPVVATGEEKAPYLLAQPFLYLTVRAPYGLATRVNGIAVDADELTGRTPVFPGAYQATTTGNALFAGSTEAATYQAGDRGVTATIQFGQPALAPDAPSAVQAATRQVLDRDCVDPPPGSYNYECPLRAPYMSYDQMTAWKITTYPTVELSRADLRRNGVQFTTGTPGSAEYTITYSDFDGITRTETGTVAIEFNGYAEIAEDGTIRAALGF